MRGVSILERLAGLCDGVLQSFTQKPQSPPHREMTVAGGTASAHDSPISAPPGLKNRRRTPLQASAPAAHVLPAPRSCSMRAIRFSRMSSRTRHAHHTARRFVRPPARPACTRFSRCCARCCARIGRLRSLVLLPWLASLPCFLALLPFPPFLPVRSTRTGKMRAFAARPGCQTVRAQAADRSCDRALQLYRPSYPRYYNPPIAGQ